MSHRKLSTEAQINKKYIPGFHFVQYNHTNICARQTHINTHNYRESFENFKLYAPILFNVSCGAIFIE